MLNLKNGKETKKLLSLLMSHNSICRKHFYLKHLYNPEKLLKIAEEKKFLENGNEDHDIIKKALMEILHCFILDEADCFRSSNPLYPVLLDNVIEIYLHELVVGLAGTDKEDVPLDPKTLPADTRREVFFSFFDASYRKYLLMTLLFREGDDLVKYLFAHYDLNHIWEGWDSYTDRVIGLTKYSYFTIGEPGNNIDYVNKNNWYLHTTEGLISFPEAILKGIITDVIFESS